MARMTKKRIDILRALLRIETASADHHQIAVKCGIPYANADRLHAPLRYLVSAGLVEIAPERTYGGGRTWRITNAGRAAASGSLIG